MTTPTFEPTTGSLSDITGSSGFGTLASATYCVTAAQTSDAKAADYIIEVSAATTNSPGGNKQVVIFAQASVDGSVYQSGPTSSSSATDEPNLQFVGVLPLASTSTTEVGFYSLAAAYGLNWIPPYFKIVLKNDLAVALTSGTVKIAEVTYTMPSV
jgi:hypothetical protein